MIGGGRLWELKAGMNVTGICIGSESGPGSGSGSGSGSSRVEWSGFDWIGVEPSRVESSRARAWRRNRRARHLAGCLGGEPADCVAVSVLSIYIIQQRFRALPAAKGRSPSDLSRPADCLRWLAGWRQERVPFKALATLLQATTLAPASTRLAGGRPLNASRPPATRAQESN